MAMKSRCRHLLVDIMNRVDSENPLVANEVWELLGELGGSDPDAARTHAAQILVPLLTSHEAARLQALMGISPLE